MVKQVLVWGVGNSGGAGGECKERVKEGEYGGSTMYSCKKMEHETC
jgi:hypothetical protein